MKPKEVTVDLPYYIIASAREKFEQGVVEPLPAQLSGTKYYLATMEDDSINMLGTIKDGEGNTYKIGTQKN